jgi:hypothetical protein
VRVNFEAQALVDLPILTVAVVVLTASFIVGPGSWARPEPNLSPILSDQLAIYQRAIFGLRMWTSHSRSLGDAESIRTEMSRDPHTGQLTHASSSGMRRPGAKSASRRVWLRPQALQNATTENWWTSISLSRFEKSKVCPFEDGPPCHGTSTRFLVSYHQPTHLRWPLHNEFV